jgi:hypothetical protein
MLQLSALVSAVSDTCACGSRMSLSDGQANSYLIFGGEAIQRFSYEDGNHDLSVVTLFKVSRVWKGLATSHLAVIENFAAACGSGFQVGHTYVVYAADSWWGVPETACIMPNQEYDDSIGGVLGVGVAPIPLWPVLPILLIVLLTSFALRGRMRRHANAPTKSTDGTRAGM